ncbi:hypothetical protein HPB47_004451 [Ixodes persulcatus]|uniref:Uncharacterized protein n=1 Tax=Ixodes persulcatus TaxID=34615 RepID=A0AC60PFW1_IXOPE|nr:hypothetical protein HPB47_004451 [Ixodes persulcatus]
MLDDEADDAAAAGNQTPPLLEVSALAVELHARVANKKDHEACLLTTSSSYYCFAFRLDLLERNLAFRFGISTTTGSRHLGHYPLWHTRQQVDEDMPPAFREKYPTIRSASFSSYKSTNTFKGLIGISPDGTVTFVWQHFLRSMSASGCVRQSGFLKLPYKKKDSVMADKGFLISDLQEEINVKLNILPFLEQGIFTEAQVKETESIG